MKKVGLVLSAALLVGIISLAGVVAGEATAAGKSHDVNVEVVSIDAKANTITCKTEKGDTMTATVLKEAQASLKNFKAGDKVTLTCKDKENGDHEGVSAIKIRA